MLVLLVVKNATSLNVGFVGKKWVIGFIINVLETYFEIQWHAEHSTMNCDEYTEWLIENDPDDETVRALNFIRRTAIVCPKCEHIYQ